MPDNATARCAQDQENIAPTILVLPPGDFRPANFDRATVADARLRSHVVRRPTHLDAPLQQ